MHWLSLWHRVTLSCHSGLSLYVLESAILCFVVMLRWPTLKFLFNLKFQLFPSCIFSIFIYLFMDFNNISQTSTFRWDYLPSEILARLGRIFEWTRIFLNDITTLIHVMIIKYSCQDASQWRHNLWRHNLWRHFRQMIHTLEFISMKLPK